MSSSPLVAEPAAGLPPAAPRAVHRGRLFRKYLLLILSLVTIALLASGAIGIYFSYQENKSALASLQHEKALAAASRIEQYIERIEQQLKYAALPQLASSETELRRLEFLKLLRQVPEVTDVAQLDGTGHEQVLVSRLGMDVIGSGKDRSSDDAFRNASRGQAWFGPVYFRKETEPYMVIAVRSGSETGPVTIADVNLKFIWDVVSKIKIGDKGKAYVVDSNGFLVADPDIGLVLRKTNLGALPHVKAASDAMAALEPAMVSSDAAGTPVLTSVAFIEPLRWRVFVEQPVAEVYAKLDASILRTALLLLGGLIVSAVGALALARGMVRPIRMLDESVRRIGAGNLDQVIDVHTGDELEALADQFNRMTVQLRESYAGLERKVDERTRELKSSLDQQTAISEILRVISASPTDVQPVLDAVAERAAHLCDATVATVLLIRDGALRPMAAYSADGGSTPTVDYIIPLRVTYITGRAAVERKTVAISDIVPLLDQEFPDARDNQRQLGFRAVLAVPLVREAGAYGVIYLYRREAIGFAPDQIALVETFARQAAIAIENVRLFNETREALDRQTATTEVLQVIARSTADVAPVFEAILRSATTLCSAERGIVFRYEDGKFRCIAEQGMSDEARAVFMAAPVHPTPDSGIGRALATRRPVHIADITDDDAYRRGDPLRVRTAELLGARTAMWVPLTKEDEVVGAFAIYRQEVRPFTDEQITLVQTFAAQAVIAIENVRLFNETREALERQTATSEVLGAISGAQTDASPVFETIARNAHRLSGATVCNVLRYDGSLLHIAASYGFPPPDDQELRKKYPIEPGDASVLSGRVILSGTVEHIDDVLTDPLYDQHHAVALGLRRLLGVPMLRDGAVQGVIVLGWAESGPTPASLVELLKTFADQAVIAIENVRLFNETKEALEQQTAISEVLRVISSSPTDVQPVLDAIAERAANLCDAAAASMYLIEGGLLRHLASKGPSPDPVTHVDALPIDRQTLTGCAVLDRKTIRVEDLLQHAQEYPLSYDIAKTLGHRAVIVTPLLREGEPFGALLLRRNEVRPFSDRDVALLRTFGDQAAIALENERLFNETTDALERQRASGEVLAAISSSIADTAPVFGKIVESCERLFSGRLVQMNLLGDDGLVRLGTYHGPGRELIEPIFPFAVDETSATGLAITRRTVLHFPDVDHGMDVPPRARQGWQALGIKAAIVAPMLWENKAIGAMLVGRNRAGPFSDKDIALLKTFADQAVIAIQNARLFREIDDKSRQLEIANKHKSDFLANMSHELRTPLNAIIGFSEVLLERLFGQLNEKQEDYLKDIHSSGRHLLHLINDILDLSKVEAGRMELELSTFDLPNAIADAMTLIRERAQRHGIETEVDVSPDLSHVVADERKFKQILLNLLSNAVKFTPDGGRIAVIARLHDNDVQIAVRDSGIGIAREDQEAVFEEFRQVGRSYTHKQEGTGLGLALTRRFVELHGGRIWVESELGRGSTFTFTFPMQR